MGAIKTAIQITDGFSPALKSMNNALSIVTSSLAQTQKALGKPVDTSAITRAQTELAKAAVSFDKIEQEANQAANGQKNLNSAMRDGESAAGSLIGKVKGLVAAYASFEGVKSLIGATDEFTNINSRLDLMNDGLQTTAELSDKIWESANRTYSSFSATADAVGRFGVQAASAFTNAEDVVNFSEQINKHLSIAGTQGAAAEGAMTQLVQAMSNGVLRGEELNSVMDGMPTVVKVIRDEFARMGDTRGIKEIAEEGLITADIVKRALYNAADETNKKFSEMGVTFMDVWNLFANHANKALQPVYKALGKISNSSGFQTFATVAGQAVGLVGRAIVFVLDSVSSLFGFIQRNAAWITPILLGVAAGFTAQGVAALWARRQFLINAAAVAWKTVCDWAATAAIIAMEFAQHGLNAALALCPLTWIIGLIIGLIVAVYLGVAAFNHFAGTSLSATGIIMGAFAALGSYLYNVVMYIWNTFVSLAEFLINVFQNPIYSIKALFVNLGVNFLDNCIAMTKGWDKFATSIANAFLEAINFVLKGWNKLIDAMPDFVKDGLGLGKATEFAMSTSITSDLTNAKSELQSLLGEKPEDYITLNRMEYMDVGANTLGAYDWGADLSEKFDVSNILGQITGATDATKELSSKELLANANKTPQTQKGYGSALDKIAANTGKTAKNTELAGEHEDMAFMRAIGEREAINRFTTAEIKVDMTNNNNVSSDMDLDGLFSAFTRKMRDALSVAAEGSHM